MDIIFKKMNLWKKCSVRLDNRVLGKCIGGRAVDRLSFTMRQNIGFQFLMDQMTAAIRN